ncbi:MAG: choice-of-anchor D domain-containing protein, partial [Planctomycetota bacterium]
MDSARHGTGGALGQRKDKSRRKGERTRMRIDRRRLAIEPLEHRQLLSIAPGLDSAEDFAWSYSDVTAVADATTQDADYAFDEGASTSDVPLARDYVGAVRPGSPVYNLQQWTLDQGERWNVDDLTLEFGLATDQVIVGDWDGDGDDDPGVIRNINGFWNWFLDTDGDRDHEIPGTGSLIFGLAADVPVVGDWDGDGRDSPGVARQHPSGFLYWYLDTNGDGDPIPDNQNDPYLFGLHGDIPVVGDWDGDGTDQLGVVRTEGVGLGWYLANANGDPIQETYSRFGLAGDQVIVGDWNGDGKDDAGVARPGLASPATMEYFLAAPFVANETTPVAEQFYFMSAGDTAVAGRWRYAEVSILYQTATGMNGVVQSGPTEESCGVVLFPGFAGVQTLLFIVTNNGNLPLQLGDVTLTGATQFAVLSQPAAEVAPGESTSFRIEFDGSSVPLLQQVSAFARIATNDGNENPYLFRLVGLGNGETNPQPPDTRDAPNIRVFDVNGTLIADGATTPQWFGAVDQNAANRPTQTFTLKNTGDEPLLIQSISLPQGFSWKGTAPTTPFSIAPGGRRVLTVQLDSAVVGIKQGELIIASNDPDTASYNFLIKGEVRGVNQPRPEIKVTYDGNREVADNQSTPIDFGTIELNSGTKQI